jgi:hypothetical protein
MIWGLSTSTFTTVHVVLSLVGIFAGLVVMFGLVAERRLDAWTVVFLATTVATSVTGFGFPFDHLLPSHKVGIVSLLVLPVAIAARYAFHLAGAWRRVYVIGAAVALYLNTFVLVVQLFLKVPALKAIAPTQKEPPFLIAQLVVLALFVVLTAMATKRFRTEPARGFVELLRGQSRFIGSGLYYTLWPVAGLQRQPKFTLPPPSSGRPRGPRRSTTPRRDIRRRSRSPPLWFGNR